MHIQVRINGSLATTLGTTRLSLVLEPPATISDAIRTLSETYPEAQELLSHAIPFLGGSHAAPSTSLNAGQQLALLMPAAGG